MLQPTVRPKVATVSKNIFLLFPILAYWMMHTKFQGDRIFSSGEKMFLRVLPHMGMAAMLIMQPEPSELLFVPPTPGGYI